jgi:hypothetical protein
MAIGDVSMSNTLASWATEMKGSNLASQIGVAVMKQIMDQQKQQGEAIIQMMQQTPRPAGSSGSVVDVYA